MNPAVKYGIIKVPNYMIFTVKQDKHVLHILRILPTVVIRIILSFGLLLFTGVQMFNPSEGEPLHYIVYCINCLHNIMSI